MQVIIILENTRTPRIVTNTAAESCELSDFQHCTGKSSGTKQDFYAPLALNCQKGQHLRALEVYKNQSPIRDRILKISETLSNLSELLGQLPSVTPLPFYEVGVGIHHLFCVICILLTFFKGIVS